MIQGEKWEELKNWIENLNLYDIPITANATTFTYADGFYDAIEMILGKMEELEEQRLLKKDGRN